jgi:hypothetical protein
MEFVEVEDETGKSVKVGRWEEDGEDSILVLDQAPVHSYHGYERLREAASSLMDALVHGTDAPEAWRELCLLCGRYCEPFLSFKAGEPKTS